MDRDGNVNGELAGMLSRMGTMTYMMANFITKIIYIGNKSIVRV